MTGGMWMPWRLKEVLGIIGENDNVLVTDENSNVLSFYDGRNAISKALLNLHVYKLEYGEWNDSPCLIITVFDPEEE